MTITKTAIVTGAGHHPGIGSQVAIDFLTAGHNVAIISRSFDQLWYQLIEKYDENILLYSGDISDPTTQQHFINQVIQKFNQIDYLINNASSNSAKYNDNGMLSYESWTENFNINVITVYNFSTLCKPYLEKTKGSIVNIGSRAASMNKVGNNLAYSVSKAALLKLTEEMAIEYAPNITVNAISPGFVDTVRLRKIFSNRYDEVRNDRLQKSLTHEFISVNEVSRMIITVLTCRAINGQNISVCGGTSLPINNSL